MVVEDYIEFYKMHGSGNDFVLMELDKIDIEMDEMSTWAKKICKRKFSVGADGLIFLTKRGQKNNKADYRWHFYNSDGSRAEMCGNGSRCAARLAYELGLAPKTHVFEADAGLIEAEIIDDNQVKVQLTQPKDFTPDIEIEIENQKYKMSFVDTGVPHAVLFVEDVNEIDVENLGAKIRYHKYFQPKGTNVNFVDIDKDNLLNVRTYERGVEKETYACGTGAAASAFVAKKLGLVNQNNIPVITSGGEKLTISISNNNTVYLTGEAILVYTGKLNPNIVREKE